MSLVEQFQVAQSVPFESAGFSSQNVRDAIVEARNTAEGKPRFTLILMADGALANPQWISYNKNLTNPMILFPVRTLIREFSFVNKEVSLGQFSLEFYKNGQSSSDLLFTYSAPSADLIKGNGIFVFTNPLSFNAGDSLYVRHTRVSGKSLSDIAIALFAQSN